MKYLCQNKNYDFKHVDGTCVVWNTNKIDLVDNINLKFETAFRKFYEDGKEIRRERLLQHNRERMCVLKLKTRIHDNNDGAQTVNCEQYFFACSWHGPKNRTKIETRK